MIRRFFEWVVGLFRAHDCKKHGHDYFARYDEILDPRLTGDQIDFIIRTDFNGQQRASGLVKIYVRDICRFCGDCLERLEGLTDMEVIAMQARRIGQ